MTIIAPFDDIEKLTGSGGSFGTGFSAPVELSDVHPYLTLALAIVSELAGTTALKYSDGFSNPLPSAVVIVGYLGAFYLLSLTLQDLDLGLVYATWAALGIVGSVAIGVTLFDESIDLAGVVGVLLVLAGVVVLNLFSEAYTPAH